MADEQADVPGVAIGLALPLRFGFRLALRDERGQRALSECWLCCACCHLGVSCS